MELTNSLNRFIDAQEKVYPYVLKELSNGKKTTHWMWFIFPQIAGLGQSSTAKYYSIKSINEATEYIAHPVLGGRLLECANILFNIDGKRAEEILGFPDNLKLRSSMTLFSIAAPEHKVFADVLQKYFAGEEDKRTLEILKTLI